VIGGLHAYAFLHEACQVRLSGAACDFVGGLDVVAGFTGGVAVDANLAGEDEALGAFAAVAQVALNEGLIQTGLGHGRAKIRSKRPGKQKQFLPPRESGGKRAALQTLRDCQTHPNRAKRLECVVFPGFGVMTIPQALMTKDCGSPNAEPHQARVPLLKIRACTSR
jgi:hypothetical protein